MNDFFYKRLYKILNSKDIRCLGCGSLVEFVGSDKIGKKPYITNLSKFVCHCGTTCNLKGITYVRFKKDINSSDKELITFLKEQGLNSVNSMDDLDFLYRSLESVEEKLFDRPIGERSIWDDFNEY